MSPKEKVLHITPWFPNQENPNEAIWIKRHIDALDAHFKNHILHLDLKKGKWKFQFEREGNFEHFQIICPNIRWIEKEVIVFFALMYYFIFKQDSKKFACLNFHIAYPNMVYMHLIKPFLKCKLLITEHWSIYHYRFHSTKALSRIKNIFRRDIGLITVSKALRKDISTFCGEDIEAHVIPNVVDTSIFKFQEHEQEDFLLMGSYWKEPKNPFLVLEAFAKIVDHYPKLRIKIFGYGPMEEEIRNYITENSLSERVEWLGKKSSNEIASLMNKSKGFIHASKYETFSVVCAEALCCGTPVLASNVGALPELIHTQNGILKRSENSWTDVLIEFLDKDYPRKDIASEASSKYSAESVGLKYAEIIRSL